MKKGGGKEREASSGKGKGKEGGSTVIKSNDKVRDDASSARPRRRKKNDDKSENFDLEANVMSKW